MSQSTAMKIRIYELDVATLMDMIGNIPEGATVEGLNTTHDRRIQVTLSHDSFDEWERGTTIPRMEATI